MSKRLPKDDRAPDLSSPEDGIFISMHKRNKLSGKARGRISVIPEIAAGAGLSVLETFEKRRSSYDRSDLIKGTLGLDQGRANKEFDMDILIADSAIQIAVHRGYNLRSRFGRMYSEIRHLQYWSSPFSYLETLGGKQPYRNIATRAVASSRDTLLADFLVNEQELLADPDKRFLAATWIGESILKAQTPLDDLIVDQRNDTD